MAGGRKTQAPYNDIRSLLENTHGPKTRQTFGLNFPWHMRK